MKKLTNQIPASKVEISHCSITNANTDDSAARLILAKAIKANADAAYALALNLGGAPMISITENKDEAS